MKEKYTRVRCILITKTRNAILVDIAPEDASEIEQRWIPLSLIHGGDESKIGNDHSTDIVEFRLMEWKARELGL